MAEALRALVVLAAVMGCNAATSSETPEPSLAIQTTEDEQTRAKSAPSRGNDGTADTDQTTDHATSDSGIPEPVAEQPPTAPHTKDPTADIPGQLLSVVHESGRFIAVGTDLAYDSNGEVGHAWILSSEDGKHWDTRYNEGSEILHSVATNGQQWIAVGWNIWSTDSGFQHSRVVLVSEDAIGWRQVGPPGDDNLDQVIWTGEAFVMRGDNKLWASPDGFEWRPISPPMRSMSQLAVSSLAVATSSESELAVSFDGGNHWEVTTSPLSPNPGWVSIWPEVDGASFGGTWVNSGAGEEGDPAVVHRLRWSQNAGWTLEDIARDVPAPLQVAHLNQTSVGIYDINRHWLAVRDSPSAAWRHATDGEGRPYSAVVAGDGVFVAVGAERLRWSADGETWEPPLSVDK